VPPAQPATEAPAWMDERQSSQWEALLPDQRGAYAMRAAMARDAVAPAIEDLPTRAAIDKEVAGASNEQIAQMMAQAGDMSGGRQGLRQAQNVASQRAGAQSAGAAAMAAGKQASEAEGSQGPRWAWLRHSSSVIGATKHP